MLPLFMPFYGLHPLLWGTLPAFSCVGMPIVAHGPSPAVATHSLNALGNVKSEHMQIWGVVPNIQ